MGSEGSPDGAERVVRRRGEESLWSPLSQGEDLTPSPPHQPEGSSPLCEALVASFQVSGHTGTHCQRDDLGQAETLSQNKRTQECICTHRTYGRLPLYVVKPTARMFIIYPLKLRNIFLLSLVTELTAVFPVLSLRSDGTGRGCGGGCRGPRRWAEGGTRRRKTNRCPGLGWMPSHLRAVKLRKQVRACEKLHRGAVGQLHANPAGWADLCQAGLNAEKRHFR